MKFSKQNIDTEKIAIIFDEINELIQEREFYFDDRTEKWQDSEKGIDFQEKTESLQGFADTLESLIEESNEWNFNNY